MKRDFSKKNKRQKESKTAGFSLIELMVAVTIFTIIIVMGIGAVITSHHAYNKAVKKNAGVDTVSFVIESMARRIRTGTMYTCDLSGGCSTQKKSDRLKFLDQDGNMVYYYLNNYTGEIMMQREGFSDGESVALTNRDIVTIKSLYFYGEGRETYTQKKDPIQPRLTIVIQGVISIRGEKEAFSLQTSVTQRKLDF
jgi:prepilin-type N-terminal cleavage/methylation domain-containing protein